MTLKTNTTQRQKSAYTRVNGHAASSCYKTICCPNMHCNYFLELCWIVSIVFVSYIPPLSKLRSPRRNWKTDGTGWAPRKRKSKERGWRRNISAYYIIPCSVQEMKYHKFISPENVNLFPSYSWALKGRYQILLCQFIKKSYGINPFYFPRETKGAFRLKESPILFL